MKTTHSDIGNLDNIESTNFFIISMPNCGTTSLYGAFNRIEVHCALRVHSNYTLVKALNTDQTIESIIKRRDKIDAPFLILSPYREPISRKISQYYQYGLPTNKPFEQKEQEIKNFCLGDFSLFKEGDKTEIDEDNVYDTIQRATEINMFDDYSSPGKAYYRKKRENLQIIYFTLSNILEIEKYIKANLLPNFNMLHEKQSGNISEFFKIRDNICFTKEELDKIYDNKYCLFFYNNDQLTALKKKYSSARI